MRDDAGEAPADPRAGQGPWCRGRAVHLGGRGLGYTLMYPHHDLAEHMGAEKMVEALRPFDRLYPQPNEESALQQMQIQLADPLPYDLEELCLAEYKNLDPRWSDWQAVKAACAGDAILIFDRIVGLDD